MTGFLAIDPGIHGAIALWRPDTNTLHVEDMPTFETKKAGGGTRNVIDAHALHGILSTAVRTLDVKLALIEKAGTRPDESRMSAHANGCNWGVAYGVLVAQVVPVQIVTPQTWKRDTGTPKDKGLARQRASALLPKHAEQWRLVKHDGRAEAALIAYYAEIVWRKQNALERAT